MLPTLNRFLTFTVDEHFDEYKDTALLRHPIFCKISKRYIRILDQIEDIEGFETTTAIEDCAMDCTDYWTAYTAYYWLQGKILAHNSLRLHENAMQYLCTIHHGFAEYISSALICKLRQRAFVSFSACWEAIQPQTRAHLQAYMHTKQLQQALRRNSDLIAEYERECDWLLSIGNEIDNASYEAVHHSFARLELPHNHSSFIAEWRQWYASCL